MMNSAKQCDCGAGLIKKPKLTNQGPPSLENSYYRRPLPSNLVSFSSEEGKQYFKESLAEGNAESYFSLVENFTTQTEPSFCGLASLTMVLNAFEVDPGRIWKGVWRWYTDEMLDCCIPINVVKQKGLTMTEFVCLAKCNGLDVTARPYNETSKEQFSLDLEMATSNKDRALVISFCRKTLNQTGDGHYSPIGCLNKSRGVALVLDVARFKYPSYWCQIDHLWESMAAIDNETGKPRGYFVLSKRVWTNCQDMEKPKPDSGLSMADVVCFARCNGLKLETRRKDQITFEGFIDDIRESTISDDLQMLVPYKGSFAPVGSFDEAQSTVTFTAIVPLLQTVQTLEVGALWKEMDSIDIANNLPAGYIILSRNACKCESK